MVILYFSCDRNVSYENVCCGCCVVRMKDALRSNLEEKTVKVEVIFPLYLWENHLFHTCAHFFTRLYCMFSPHLSCRTGGCCVWRRGSHKCVLDPRAAAIGHVPQLLMCSVPMCIRVATLSASMQALGNAILPCMWTHVLTPQAWLALGARESSVLLLQFKRVGTSAISALQHRARGRRIL